MHSGGEIMNFEIVSFWASDIDLLIFDLTRDVIDGLGVNKMGFSSAKRVRGFVSSLNFRNRSILFQIKTLQSNDILILKKYMYS